MPVVLVADALISDQAELLAMARELLAFERTLRAARRTSLLPSTVVDGWLRELDEHEGRLLIARIDGKPVGFARCLLRDDELDEEPGVLHVAELYVREAARGAGVGKALLAAAEQAARRAGARRLTIDALAGNEPASHAYEALGFAPAYVTYERELGRRER